MSLTEMAGPEDWKAFQAGALVPLLIPGSRAFSGRVAVVNLGGIAVSRLVCGTGSVVRPDAVIARDPCDAVLLSLALTGSIRVARDFSQIPNQDSDSALCLSDRPYIIETSMQSDILTVRIERRHHPGLANELVALHGRPLGTPTSAPSQILQSFLVNVLNSGLRDRSEMQVIENVIFELFSMVIRSETVFTSTASRRSSHYENARAIIKDAFRDVDLTVDTVAQRCGISRRRLEILFAENGSAPAMYLRSVRLESARDLLADPAGNLLVRDVAYLVGFNDTTTFSRAFHRQYGVPPHVWRSASVQTDSR